MDFKIEQNRTPLLEAEIAIKRGTQRHSARLVLYDGSSINAIEMNTSTNSINQNNTYGFTIALDQINSVKTSAESSKAIMMQLVDKQGQQYIVEFLAEREAAKEIRKKFKEKLNEFVAANKQRENVEKIHDVVVKLEPGLNHKGIATSTATTGMSIYNAAQAEEVSGESKLLTKVKKELEASLAETDTQNKAPKLRRHTDSKPFSLAQAVIEAKAALIANNADLRRLHVDLVKSQQISEDEFWQNRQHLISRELGRYELQRTGVSAVDLTGARLHTTDNDLENLSKPDNQIRIDSTLIMKIFTDNPKVHKAYQAVVPDKMSEREFWTTYFRKERAMRHQREQAAAAVAAASTKSSKSSAISHTKAKSEFADYASEDIFAEYSQDEPPTSEANRMRMQRIIDPSIDISRYDATDSILSEQQAEVDADSVEGNNVNSRSHPRLHGQSTDIISKFNRMSMLVVDAPNSIMRNETLEKSTSQTTYSEHLFNEKYRQTIEQEMRLDDLTVISPPSYISLSVNAHGGVAIVEEAKGAISSAIDFEKQRSALFTSLNVLSNSQNKNSPLISRPSPDRCRSVTIALSQRNKAVHMAATFKLLDGNATHIFTSDAPEGTELPLELRERMRSLFQKHCELLRHYWSCFPVIPQTLSKVQRLHASLQTHRQVVDYFRTFLNSIGSAHFVSVLDCFYVSLSKAADAYRTFSSRYEQMIVKNPALAGVGASSGAESVPGKRFISSGSISMGKDNHLHPHATKRQRL